MKIDLSKFSKVRSDRDYTDMKSPEGHLIRLSHSALSPEDMKSLGSIPKNTLRGYYEGGGVMGEDEEEDITPEPTPSAGQSPTTTTTTTPSPVPNQITDEAPGLVPADAQSNVGTSLQQGMGASGVPDASPTNYNLMGGAGQTNTDPFGMQQYLKNYQGDVNQVLGGIQGEAQAQGNLGKQQAPILDQAAQNLQDLQQRYIKNVQNNQNERAAFIRDAQHDKIPVQSYTDMKSYWNNLSTPGKIMTTMGLILGGLGGKDGNGAVNFINGQIDRNIQNMQRNAGIDKTLLSANQEQFGNINQATTMTRANLYDIMSLNLQKAADLSQDPMSKARAMQAAGQFKLQADSQIHNLSMQQAMLSGMNNGSVSTEQAIRAIVPEKDQKDVFDDLKKAQDAKNGEQAILDSFDKAAAENTLVGRASRAGYNPASVGALQTQLLPLLKDAGGRINTMEMERVDKLLPQPFDVQSTQNEKRAALLNFIREKQSTPRLKSYGIAPQATQPLVNPNVPKNYPK